MASKIELDPRISEDRIAALLSNYTAERNSCPYYNGGSNIHQCEFDKTSRRVWDCRGICFENGFTCQYIIQYQEQYEMLEKVINRKNSSF